MLKTIAGGDWSDETQRAVEKAVKEFAEDFGYDLDEEGLPLEDEDDAPRRTRDGDESRDGGRAEDSGESDGSAGEEEGEGEGEGEQQEETVPA